MKKNLGGVWAGLAVVAVVALSSMQGGLAQDRTGWPQSLTLATVPVEGSQDATERFKPFVAYLEKTLGLKVTFRNGTDYAAVIVAQAARQVDIAYYGPGSYLDAEDRANAEAFAVENSIKNGAGYFSLIISKAGSPIKTMADARGQEFAFVDPASTSGFRVPMFSFCTDLKIEPEQYFKRVFFAGTHENVIVGVANGRIPLGATNDLSLNSAIEKGVVKSEKEFNIVYKSKLIPGSPVAYRKDLPATLKAAIKDAYLKFDDKKWLEDYSLKGYLATSPVDYQAFRQINSYKSSNCPK
jgi:phosphonate transport system substrate-binding protein